MVILIYPLTMAAIQYIYFLIIELEIQFELTNPGASIVISQIP